MYVGFLAAQFPVLSSENLVKYHLMFSSPVTPPFFQFLCLEVVRGREGDSLSPHPLVSVIALIDLCPAGRERPEKKLRGKREGRKGDSVHARKNAFLPPICNYSLYRE